MTDTGHCGTIYGRDLHYRAGESACDACKAAANEVDRKRRADPDKRAQEQRRASARLRAQVRLAQLYPDVYAALYAEEKKRDEP